MPYLALVHVRAPECPVCGTVLAPAGARSFLVDAQGLPFAIRADDRPAEMTVEIACPNGHRLGLVVPDEISAEETLDTPESAPIAPDAVLLAGKTESGAAL